MNELLRVEGLSKHFGLSAGVLRRRTGAVQAVDDVSFTVSEGETLGLVGESGCGKSTVVKTVLRLLTPTAGRITFGGDDITTAPQSELRRLRRDMAIVFQDPYSSLNPRLRVGSIVGEPLRVHRDSARAGAGAVRGRVGELLEQVGLAPEHARRYPHEFSGGQRQRIAIARAIATRPKLLFCDEPVSALDVSIRGQILNLLTDLQEQLGLSYVLVSHDLSVVRDVADRVAVMYLGKLVEVAGTVSLYDGPRHPYTRALISAVPIPSRAPGTRRERIVLQGEMPAPSDPPSGCRFRTRCWKAETICAVTAPPLLEMAPGHWAACHFPEPAGPITSTRPMNAVDMHSTWDR